MEVVCYARLRNQTIAVIGRLAQKLYIVLVIYCHLLMCQTVIELISKYLRKKCNISSIGTTNIVHFDVHVTSNISLLAHTTSCNYAYHLQSVLWEQIATLSGYSDWK